MQFKVWLRFSVWMLPSKLKTGDKRKCLNGNQKENLRHSQNLMKWIIFWQVPTLQCFFTVVHMVQQEKSNFNPPQLHQESPKIILPICFLIMSTICCSNLPLGLQQRTSYCGTSGITRCAIHL